MIKELTVDFVSAVLGEGGDDEDEEADGMFESVAFEAWRFWSADDD